MGVLALTVGLEEKDKHFASLTSAGSVRPRGNDSEQTIDETSITPHYRPATVIGVRSTTQCNSLASSESNLLKTPTQCCQPRRENTPNKSIMGKVTHWERDDIKEIIV
ncbi:hypothetical protein WMY93_003867 [Mugilogobius chulae]|uniref:Uncharacterized protein n=1 Tax=Mugilogobius chulae TaxID=88201 RepID=A0AAW0PXW8_9GOBI